MGAAGVGLLGGFELAAGVLLGAGIIAIADRRDGHRMAPEAKAAAHTVRERAQRLIDRAPETLRERARAVIQAARGKLQPITSQPSRQSQPSQPSPQPQTSRRPQPEPELEAEAESGMAKPYSARDEFAEDAELGIPTI